MPVVVNFTKTEDIVAAYWAISYLGLMATAVGIELGLIESAVSRAAERGAAWWLIRH
jgi:hypothetical protein